MSVGDRHTVIQQEDDAHVVRLLDANIDDIACNALMDELQQFVYEKKPRQVIVSFARVKRVTSSAFKVLLTLRRQLLKNGGQLMLSDMRPELCEKFRLLNLDRTVFDISSPQLGQ